MGWSTIQIGPQALLLADIILYIFTPLDAPQARQWFWRLGVSSNIFILFIYFPFGIAPAQSLMFGFWCMIGALLALRYIFAPVDPFLHVVIPWAVLVGPPVIELAIRGPLWLIKKRREKKILSDGSVEELTMLCLYGEDAASQKAWHRLEALSSGPGLLISFIQNALRMRKRSGGDPDRRIAEIVGQVVATDPDVKQALVEIYSRLGKQWYDTNKKLADAIVKQSTLDDCGPLLEMIEQKLHREEWPQPLLEGLLKKFPDPCRETALTAYHHYALDAKALKPLGEEDLYLAMKKAMMDENFGSDDHFYNKYTMAEVAAELPAERAVDLMTLALKNVRLRDKVFRLMKDHLREYAAQSPDGVNRFKAALATCINASTHEDEHAQELIRQIEALEPLPES